MPAYLPIWIALVLAVGALLLINNVVAKRKARRKAYIEEYAFRQELLDKLGHHYPHLTKLQIEQVMNGLRTYFIFRLQHGDHIAVPSKVVDALWHEFILFTKDYELFCKKAFGCFLNHTPYTGMTSPENAHSWLPNVWQYSCEQEGINPIFPYRLPLLFKLDNELKIPDSYGYSVEQFQVDDLPHYIHPKLNPERNIYTITPDLLRPIQTTEQDKKSGWGVLALIGGIFYKFKFLLVAFKFAKFIGTFASMFLMIALYTRQMGWWYAFGFVLLIALHECGHMLAAKLIGIPVSMPLFIPFVGAFITMKQQPTDARSEAIMAAGGPVLGSLGALACLVAGLMFNNNLLVALAYSGCLLNLLNLIPVHPLDGGRMVGAISPLMWLIGIPLMAFAALVFYNPITILLLILGVIQAWKIWRSPDKSYYQVSTGTRLGFAAIYFGLMVVLGSAMTFVMVFRVPNVQVNVTAPPDDPQKNKYTVTVHSPQPFPGNAANLAAISAARIPTLPEGSKRLQYTSTTRDYVPLDQIRIKQKFDTVLLTKENLAREKQKCLPFFQNNTDNMRYDVSDIPRNNAIVTVANPSSSKRFIYSGTTGLCLEFSANKFPIYAVETFIRTANPTGVPPDITNDWYMKIAMQIALKSKAKVAYITDKGAAYLVSYWSEQTGGFTLHYSWEFKKIGEWENTQVDYRFFDPRLRGLSVTNRGYAKEMIKRFPLAQN